MTDMHGKPLDFGTGRTLKSKGIIACERHVHSRVLEAVKKVIST